MNNKKIKLQKLLSLSLAFIMLFQIPLTSFNIYATEETETSSENSEILEITDETSSEAKPITQEEIVNNEPLPNNEILQLNDIINADDVEDYWDLDITFTDSAYNSAATPLTEINWDASDSSYKKGSSRTIKVQIIYTKLNSTEIYPAETIEIRIPNLAYNINSNYNAQLDTTIVVGANDSTHSGLQWNFKTGTAPSTSQEYFSFYNAVPLDLEPNAQGSIEITYVFTPSSEAPEEFLDECLHSYSKTLQATIGHVGDRTRYEDRLTNTEHVITSPNYPNFYTFNSSTTWEYTSDTLENLEIYFDSSLAIASGTTVSIYDNTGTIIYKITDANDHEFKSKKLLINGNYIQVRMVTGSTSSTGFSLSIGSGDVIEKAFIIPEGMAISNEINFNYTRTYIHPWQKRTFTLTKTASKIPSLDGFPAGDYYWVKYNFSASNNYTTKWTTDYPYIGVKVYIKDTFPEECIILNSSLTQLSLENGEYQSAATTSQYYGSISFSTLYVGYPKSIYNEDAGTTEITNTAELYAKHENEDEFYLVAEDDIDLNLTNFEFTYSGSLYSINKGSLNNHGELIYQDIISYLEKNSSNNVVNYYINVNAKYVGTPITVKIGDDLLFSEINNTIERISDDVYHFSSVTFPTLKNGNNQSITAGKYNCELWVRYKNTNEYVLYEEFTNKQKSWSFTTEQGIVSFYFIIHDMIESITCSSYAYEPYNGSFQATIRYYDTEIPQSGQLHNFCYLQVFFKDENNNLVLQNKPSLANYSSQASKANIATYDMETYGTYMQRSNEDRSWYYYENALTYRLYALKEQTSIFQNAKEEKFTGSYTIGYYIDTNKHSLSDYMVYDQEIPDKHKINGLIFYDLLPKGMELKSSAEEIKESFAFANYSDPNASFYKMDLTKFATEEEAKAFFMDRTTIDIIYNYNQTGRTLIKITMNFSDEPLIWFNYLSDYQKFKQTLTFKYNFSISYDSYLEFGETWDNTVYEEFINKTECQNYDSTVQDNGEEDPDIYDINNNGSTYDLFGYAKCSTTIISVISTHQDVAKYVKTDQNDYTPNLAIATVGSEYKYKLRVRSGNNNITNLIIYDNLETAQQGKPRWQGEFLGIDTSYAENKLYKHYDPSNALADNEGYVSYNVNVNTYYSENPQAGNLYDDNGNLSSEWKEFISPKYTNGLAITFNENCATYHSSDYLRIYYEHEGKTYRTQQYSGTALAGQTIEIPSNDFYIYWYTNYSGNTAYGFSIDKIEPCVTTNILGYTTSGLPSLEVIETTGTTYPESEHNPYKNSELIFWHYSTEAILLTNPTDTSLVKSLAFEYIDSEGNPAIIPANNLTYVLIKMKAPNDETINTLARNNCRTQWNAIDEFDRPVNYITGITSNVVNVTFNEKTSIVVNKIWDDNNNALGLRPKSIDIILNKNNQEVARQTLSDSQTTVTFEDILVKELDSYEINEECSNLYETTNIIYNSDTECWDITNKLIKDATRNFTGIKIWENDMESQRPESITINLLQDGTIFASTTTTAEQNWEYSFANIPKYKSDRTRYEYSIEELPIENYFTSYVPDKNGLAIKFNSQSYTNDSGDYVSIYYMFNNIMYKLGNYYSSNLAGKTINIPSRNFYLYWHTNSSGCNKYGFLIDSITPINTEQPNTATEATLPDFEIIETSGLNYPSCVFDSYTHGNYGNNIDKLWYYYTDVNYNIVNTRHDIDISFSKTWENDTPEQRPQFITINLLRDGIKYKSKEVTAADNWQYVFENVPKYKADYTQYKYTVEEVPVDRYITSYDTSQNGLAITFNNQFATESASYDYVKIYYVLNKTTYLLGTWGGTSLAGQTIQVPTNDFYLYWKTDSSQCSYYGFSIDSIEAAEVEHLSTTNTSTLPPYTVDEISGDTYPDSAFESYTHGNYGNNINKVWHYTGDSNEYTIINTRNSTNIHGTKTWEGDTESQRPESITVKLLQDGVEYTTTTATADTNWEYSFLDVPKFRDNGSLYEYSIEEVPVNGYTTKYGNETSGVAITFNNQFATESTSYDWVDIYYVLDGTTYKLGRWGGANTSSTSLAGKTIYVPTKDFYLWWRTDGSVNSYYGFSIDSIIPAEVEHVSTTSTATLPTGTVKEISGSTYPESAHSPYANNANKIWHYTCTDVIYSYSDTPQPGVFKIVNIRSSVSAEINKKDFFTNEALTDVTFNLYKLVDIDTTHNHGIATENDCWENAGTFTTDENGLLTLDNLSPNTVYGIIETTPDGYVLPNDTYWKMIVGSDQSITFETVGDTDTFYDRYGWTGYRLDIEASDDGYILYNIPEFRTIEATKRIKASEINFYNGNPTFLFKLTGTDVSNTVRTYYQGIEFTEEYVAANTNSDGYVTIAVVFEDLIKGTYTLSEEEVSRYSIETISDVENGTAVNDAVTFDLEINTSGKATFTNKKYEFRWFSHNDFIINAIKAILDDED